jgi:energy-coupling factor transporter ATP-binding protein EcfA2
MKFVPVERLDIQEYGCVRDLALELTPLHALIGPNDSGKSTVLRALRTLAQLASGRFGLDASSGLHPFDPLLGPASSLRVKYSDGKQYRIATRTEGGIKEEVWADGTKLVELERELKWPRQWPDTRDAFLTERLTKPTMVRFEPDYLRSPSPLIPENEPVAFADERGRGLASVYDATTGWRTVGAMKWSKIRKLRAHGPSPNEVRNVRALILDAKEARADVLAFPRDADGESAAHQPPRRARRGTRCTRGSS